MKKTPLYLTLLIITMFMLSACTQATTSSISEYDKEYDYVVNYLNEKYGGKYTIKQCNFQQYDHGITGGQFLYDFSIEDQKGQKYTAHYGRLTDLSKDTVEYIKFEAMDCKRKEIYHVHIS